MSPWRQAHRSPETGDKSTRLKNKKNYKTEKANQKVGERKIWGEDQCWVENERKTKAKQQEKEGII